MWLAAATLALFLFTTENLIVLLTNSKKMFGVL
jgi:hypothetical protein